MWKKIKFETTIIIKTLKNSKYCSFACEAMSDSYPPHCKYFGKLKYDEKDNYLRAKRCIESEEKETKKI